MDRKLKYIFLSLSFMVVFHFGFSQNKEEEKSKQIEQAIESIAQSDEVEITNSVELEDITRNAEHPININTATTEELEQLNMLDFNQIQNILLRITV